MLEHLASKSVKSLISMASKHVSQKPFREDWIVDNNLNFQKEIESQYMTEQINEYDHEIMKVCICVQPSLKLYLICQNDL